MSYQVLARKWRPRSFETLVGQEHVVKALTHALEQQRLHHAYLFTGTRGVGKTTIARILAKSLNCETGITAKPCGVCSACTEIDAGRFIDLLEVDAATNTKVDEMRQLLENAVYAPTRGRFKVYVIDEVHMLSNAAFNSMLKTLEEPPEHIKFILATTDPQKIPVTVLSRCLQFNLKQMPQSGIVGHLQRIMAEEGVNGEPAALRLIAQGANGSMRDALSLLDQAIAYSQGEVSEDAVRAMLGTVDTAYLFNLLDALAENNAKRMFDIAADMESRSVAFDSALVDMGTILHRIALAQLTADALPEDTPERERIVALAQIFDAQSVQLYYQIVIHGRQDLPLAPDEYAGFTMALMRMLAFAPSSETEKTSNTIPKGPVAVINPPPVAASSRDSADTSDWPSLVRSLKLVGAAKQLAERSELVSRDANTFTLRIAKESQALASTASVEKLKAALQEAVGQPVKLNLNVGQTGGANVAAIVEGERRERHQQANQQMNNDPFVRELMNSLDATIESVQPVQQGPQS
ncbi:MAG TPA: DNA polymerase III subunit gamma/tau [Burkholderiales bacterium]|nr:DNA polymerase III subunit gamma/tau [Burkholderiales bacterium]